MNAYCFYVSLVEDHLGSFRFLVIRNKATTDFCIQVFVWT